MRCLVQLAVTWAVSHCIQMISSLSRFKINQSTQVSFELLEWFHYHLVVESLSIASLALSCHRLQQCNVWWHKWYLQYFKIFCTVVWVNCYLIWLKCSYCMFLSLFFKLVWRRLDHKWGHQVHSHRRMHWELICINSMTVVSAEASTWWRENICIKSPCFDSFLFNRRQIINLHNESSASNPCWWHSACKYKAFRTSTLTEDCPKSISCFNIITISIC